MVDLLAAFVLDEDHEGSLDESFSKPIFARAKHNDLLPLITCASVEDGLPEPVPLRPVVGRGLGPGVSALVEPIRILLVALTRQGFSFARDQAHGILVLTQDKLTQGNQYH